MDKDYFVPFADFGEDRFEEKRSKFTGRLWHVETAEDAVAKIKEMREKYWDATHNCYAYILREGETEAPQELQALLDTGNRFRQIVMDSMVIGKDGNAVFDEAMRLAKLEGIQPMLYTHPVGTFGHGAGPAIGMYTNQGFVAGTGERVIDEDTCFALELNVYDNLACWGGQRVFMYLEEDICRAAECDYIDGHQTKLVLL